MTIPERYEIIQATIKRQRYNIAESIYLIVLVFAGMVCFMSGRLSVRIGKLCKMLSSTRTRREQ